jgi:hypothetical protein
MTCLALSNEVETHRKPFVVAYGDFTAKDDTHPGVRYKVGLVCRTRRKHIVRMTLVAGCLVISALSLVACRTEKPAEGPAERAGKKVDRAADKTKETGKDAADATKETAEDAKKNVEKKTDKKD